MADCQSWLVFLTGHPVWNKKCNFERWKSQFPPSRTPLWGTRYRYNQSFWAKPSQPSFLHLFINLEKQGCEKSPIPRFWLANYKKFSTRKTIKNVYVRNFFQNVSLEYFEPKVLKQIHSHSNCTSTLILSSRIPPSKGCPYFCPISHHHYSFDMSFSAHLWSL